MPRVNSHPLVDAELHVPPSAILRMLARGMTPREINTLFPSVPLDAPRNILLRVADRILDPDWSLSPLVDVDALIDRAKRASKR